MREYVPDGTRILPPGVFTSTRFGGVDCPAPISLLLCFIYLSYSPVYESTTKGENRMSNRVMAKPSCFYLALEKRNGKQKKRQRNRIDKPRLRVEE